MIFIDHYFKKINRIKNKNYTYFYASIVIKNKTSMFTYINTTCMCVTNTKQKVTIIGKS